MRMMLKLLVPGVRKLKKPISAPEVDAPQAKNDPTGH
jgi:hypothetical protein